MKVQVHRGEEAGSRGEACGELETVCLAKTEAESVLFLLSGMWTRKPFCRKVGCGSPG